MVYYCRALTYIFSLKVGLATRTLWVNGLVLSLRFSFLSLVDFFYLLICFIARYHFSPRRPEFDVCLAAAVCFNSQFKAVWDGYELKTN